MRFEELIGKTISVLLTGKDNKKEAYTGVLEEIQGDYLILKFLNTAHTIDRVVVRKDVIESMWIYKDGVRGEV